jgi:uncharacterized protein (TIGR02118 family)
VVKLVFCLHRRSDIDEDEFHRYWREVHGPLAASLGPVLGIRRYVQLHTIPGGFNHSLAAGRGAPDNFDGVAELWFDSLESMIAGALSAEGSKAAETLRLDEEKFIDHSRSPIFVGEEEPFL